jgi:reactive intermediate/imine deaminase
MQIITTPNAPAPIGPYNQAIVHNGLLYMSGQIAIDPVTNALVMDSIAAETHQVMRNLQAVLEAAGTHFDKAIKTTINASLKYTYIAYNGEVNSPVGYEMLQALNVGNNLTWTFNWLQKIGEGLQMNMVYEGRNSQGLGRLVHVGRMQVTALF